MARAIRQPSHIICLNLFLAKEIYASREGEMMRGMAIASTLLAALITLVVAPTVHAKRFTSQDSEMLSTITKRFSAARRDSLDAMQASVSTHNLDVSECLSSIMESISITDEIVSSASIFVLLSS